MAKLLTTQEVAEICRTSPETLKYWRFRGDYGPPSFKIGRRVLYEASAVEAWLDGLRAAGTKSRLIARRVAPPNDPVSVTLRSLR